MDYAVKTHKLKNIYILSALQSLFGINLLIMLMLGAFVAQMLLPVQYYWLSTAPIGIMVFTSLIMTYPASYILNHFGYHLGFAFALFAGITGAATTIIAIIQKDFTLYIMASMCFGVYQSFSGYYRFAAADISPSYMRGQAISWVIGGGIFAAFFTPLLIDLTKDLLIPIPFIGTFIALAFINLSALTLPFFLEHKYLEIEENTEIARPLKQIISHKKFMIALLCAFISYASMNFIVSITPLAVVGCGYSVGDAAFVVQGHAFAMYAPAFIIPYLLKRISHFNITLIGILCLLSAAIFAYGTENIIVFWITMFIMGIGWNFAFIGATSILTECYKPCERKIIQPFHDVVVFGGVAIASFSSGYIFYNGGWNLALMILIPILAFCIIGLIAYKEK
jgi:MFS family permease